MSAKLNGNHGMNEGATPLIVDRRKLQAILLFGAPGSGKGTQGTILGKIPGYTHISTGELFRNLQLGSPLAKIFLDCSSKGQLVPNEYTIQLWKDYVDGLIKNHRFDPQQDTLLLDGIPRTTLQAEMMDEFINVSRVYYLDCKDKKVMYIRLQRRALIENRLDDASEEVINNRLKIYESQTFPVLHHYNESVIRQIDTSRSPVEVLAEIVDDMAKIGRNKANQFSHESVLAKS